jgi:hypothetical protein
VELSGCPAPHAPVQHMGIETELIEKERCSQPVHDVQGGLGGSAVIVLRLTRGAVSVAVSGP